VRLEALGEFIPSIVENMAALTIPAAILRNNLIVYVYAFLTVCRRSSKSCSLRTIHLRSARSQCPSFRGSCSHRRIASLVGYIVKRLFLVPVCVGRPARTSD
jgi:hypothetical protein